MKMQDKEFDELFRSQLADLEVTPSERVWGGIAEELSEGKRKKSLVFVLSIAASVLVLVAAGVWVIAKKDNLGTKAPVYTNTKKQTPGNGSIIAKTNPVVDSLKTTDPQPAVITAIKNKPATSLAGIKPKKQLQIAEPVKPTLLQKQDEMIQRVQQPELIIATQKLPESIKVVPDDVPLTIQTVTDEQQPFKTLPVASTSQPQLANQTTRPAKTKHGIRSLGDLINVVVAKVDKRKDKVIEFTDNEDGDGDNVTGLNLGIIKIKKEK